MEYVICDLCGADSSGRILTRIDRFSKQAYTFTECGECGLIYLNPRPTKDELPDHYPPTYEAYQDSGENHSSISRWHINQALGRQLDFIEKHSDQLGQLLDIGCATGNFINAALERGWQASGIELDDRSVQIARKRGLEVQRGTVDTLHAAPCSFDVITMWDVLEHLPSPRSAVRKCHQLLKTGGILAFSIPNLSSFDRYLFGERWIGWDAPRHFHLFSSKTIEQLISSEGFEIKEINCFLGGKGTFLLSLDNVFDSSALRRLYPILSAALWPYRQLVYAINRGPIIAYVVRKLP